MESKRKKLVLENYSLMAVDFLCVLFAHPIAYLLRYRTFRGFLNYHMIAIVCVLVFFSIFFHVILKSGNDYFSRGPLKEAMNVLLRAVVLFISIGYIIFLFKLGSTYSRLYLGYFFAANAVTTYIFRMIVKKILLKDFLNGKKGDNVLLITEPEHFNSIKEQIKINADWSVHLVETVFSKVPANFCCDNYIVCHDINEVLTTIKNNIVDIVLINSPDYSKEDISRLIESIQLMGITCHYCPELPARQLFKIGVKKIASTPVISFYSLEYDYRLRLIKRIVDIIFAIIGLVITAALTPFIALAIKLDSPGPVFFSQARVSKNGRQFKLYKFRSMYQNAEEIKTKLMSRNEMKGAIFKLKDDPRITRVGKFLRKTSLDELPQFWNILKADMSLVGTRPPTVAEYEQYDDYQRRRLSIRPGLTGMWQVSGRSSITDFDEIVKLDFEYIDNWSLYLDLKIILRTFAVIIGKEGAE